VFIFLIPGLIGYALHQKGLMVIPSKAEGIDGDQVFPTMVSALLPIGLRGLVVAGLLSALMSSLASLFNSCATLFTLDIYSKLKPNQSEKHYVSIGRLATSIVVICGLIWIPIMKAMAGGGIYKYLQQVQGYLAPPITAVFLLGLFWKKTNATGAFVGLISGFILGILKLLIEAVVSFNEIQYGILKNIADFNFLYYSGILFLVSVIIMIITSIMTNNNQPEQTNGLSYDTLTEKDKREIRESWNYWDIIGTVIVLGCVLGIYIYFSYWL